MFDIHPLLPARAAVGPPAFWAWRDGHCGTRRAHSGTTGGHGAYRATGTLGVVLWFSGLWLAPLLVVTAALPAQAQAQAQEQATPSHSEYLRLIEQAVLEFREGNWQEARASFQAAHEVEPSARTLRGIGNSEFEDRSYVASIRTLRKALADTRRPLTPAQRAQVTAVIERAEGYIARYSVELWPAEATLRVDGRAPTVVEGALLLDPGVHQIEVTLDGHRDVVRQLRVRAHEGGHLRVELTPETPAAVAEAPTAKGSEARQSPTPPHAEDPWLNTRRRVGVGIVGLGAVGLSTSLGLMLSARSKRDEAACEDTSDGVVCASAQSQALREHAQRLARAATATAVAGAVALATGLLLFVWPERERRPDRADLQTTLRGARIVPMLSPGQAGVAWGGQF